MKNKYNILPIKPVEPTKRIEILDVIRGFALLGIIFNNMLYFSGYAFMPYEELGQITNLQLKEKIYDVLDIIITGKFYTLFSILFAVGFNIQYTKHHPSGKFLTIYHRRLFILLILGLIHSLVWFGDILLTYALVGFVLISFRNLKPKRLIFWSRIFQSKKGKSILKYLVPMGRMALSNYLFQTCFMITIFYNFGFDLKCKLGLIPIMEIVICLLTFQIILSNF